MGIKSTLKEEKSDFKNIFNMFRKRNFEGNTGQAVKNGSYQFASLAVIKVASLIFTVIMARILMPELFGLYSLAISTIILFSSFSDFGINQALVRYVSKSLGNKNDKKAGAYVKYLFKLKIVLLLGSSIIIILASNLIANSYYKKPIFLALLAGSFYILFSGLLSFIDKLFYSANKFRYPFYKELFLQISRMIIIPLVALFALKQGLSSELSLFWMVLGFSLIFFFSLIFVMSFVKRHLPFLQDQSYKLKIREKREITRFILPLTTIALSGVFFSYIDMIMLGRFVLAEYIGFYRAAFSLIGSVGAVVGFSAALFPIFSRLKGKRLERGFKKTRNLTLLASILATIVTILLSSIIVTLIFGRDYSPAIFVLRVLSPLLIILPVIGLYDTYIVSRGNTLAIAKLLIISTLANIILNYVLISWLIGYGDLYAVIGASIATIISRVGYLLAIVVLRKKMVSI